VGNFSGSGCAICNEDVEKNGRCGKKVTAERVREREEGGGKKIINENLFKSTEPNLLGCA